MTKAALGFIAVWSTGLGIANLCVGQIALCLGWFAAAAITAYEYRRA